MKWFKKKATPKVLPQNNTSRLYDIYGEGYNFRYLEDKVDNTAKELSDKIDSNVADLKPLETKVAENTNNIITNIKNIQAHGTLLTQHSTEIKDNLTKINKISNDLTNANLANYRGIYVTTNTYNLGDLVSNNADNNVYLSVKSNNRNHPLTDNNYWKIITFTVDTSDYVSKQYVDGALKTVPKLNTTSDQRWTGGNVFEGNTGFASRINMNNNKIINLGTPTSDTDATNKKYVDNIVAGVFKSGGFYTNCDLNVTINKSDLYSHREWHYTVEINKDVLKPFLQNTLPDFNTKMHYILTMNIYSTTWIDGTNKQYFDNSLTILYNDSVYANTRYTFNIIRAQDWRPGSAGNYAGRIQFSLVWREV